MRGETWTPETDRLIAALRSQDRLSLREIAQRVNRSPAATSVRLRKLGVRIHDRKEWSPEEEAFLREGISAGRSTIRALAVDLGRGECSVRWKMESLGLVPGRVRRWSEAEVARLVEASAAGEAEVAKVAAELGRSLESARERLRAAGVRNRLPWTEADDERLRAMVDANGRVNAIALELGRNPSSVSGRARKLGLAFADQPQAWLACEEGFLREIAAARGTGPDAVSEMARRTARSERAVRARLKALGIRGLRKPAAAISPARKPAVRAPAKPVAPANAERPYRALPSMPVPAAPAPKPALSADLEDAIARFIREKGVTTAAGADPERETVRLVRARGYAVTGSGVEGFLVDGRVRLGGLEALRDFAARRGIEVPVA